MTTIEKLLVLQERDRRIRQLSKESEDIPARRSLIESRLKEHKEALQAAQEELKKKQSGAKQVELEIETLKQRILKLREQQNSIKSNEEYRAIEKEVANIQKQIRDQEDAEIVIMEDMEKSREGIREAEGRLKQEEAIVQTDVVALEQRLKNLQGEIAKLKTDRQALVHDVDASWLSRYERTFKHTGDYGLVPVENGSCGGCHMRLPPQVVQNAKKSLNMVFCGFCGRILYWRP